MSNIHSKQFLVWLIQGMAKQHSIRPTSVVNSNTSYVSIPLVSSVVPSIVYELMLVVTGKEKLKVTASINICEQDANVMTRVAVIAMNDAFEYGNWSVELTEILDHNAKSLMKWENEQYKKMLLSSGIIEEGFCEDSGETLSRLEDMLSAAASKFL